MDQKLKFNPPLSVHKDQSKLSHPQKCKIPQKFSKFSASNLVKVKSDQRTFICRLYYLNEVYDDKSIAFVDESVELGAEKSQTREINLIDELEVIKDPETNFAKVRVKVFMNPSEIDLKIVKTPSDLVKLIKSILKFYTFSSDCLISCQKNGINKIHVIEGSNGGFGSLTDESEVEIAEIIIDNNKNDVIKLGGLEDAERSLTNFIRSNIEAMKDPKVNKSSGCLIIGPGGSGKSSLIHKVASTLHCNIFEVSTDIFKPYPGETEEELQKIFHRVKAITNLLIPSNPSIILIENIEIFCPKFDHKMKENSHSLRVASQIFSFLDEISSSRGIMVIGTTSKIDSINPSLKRSSRMASEILIDMPNESQRFEIVKALSSSRLKLELNDELCKFIAESTPGFVGADFEVLFQFVARNSQENDLKSLFEKALRNINPSVMRDNLGIMHRSTMKFDDIGGMDELKKTLQTAILGPLRHREKYQKLGLRSPSGILLYGPSGCAKTTIVKCLAGETRMTLITVSSAEIYSPYVGEAEKFLIRLFNQARMSAPTILFFDEIDTIVGSRSDSSNDTHMGILSTLLTEIDGFGGDASASKNKPILIVGATNRPASIDDALMRPGRFDKLIHIPAPDFEGRVKILEFILKKMPIDNDVDIKSIAERTKNFSGADLVNLCNEAALCAATRNFNCENVTREDFENVLAFLRPSLSEEKILYYENYERRRKSGK